MNKIGLGGGCHWCTEGVFQSLKGVSKVEQGWIASENEHSSLSEAVIVHFDPTIISLINLIEIHLITHASTAEHSMRQKYRSAIYCFNEGKIISCQSIIDRLQKNKKEQIITKILKFTSFKSNKKEYLNYLYSKPASPFCETYIHPKFTKLMQQFRQHLDEEKLKMLGWL